MTHLIVKFVIFVTIGQAASAFHVKPAYSLTITPATTATTARHVTNTYLNEKHVHNLGGTTALPSRKSSSLSLSKTFTETSRNTSKRKQQKHIFLTINDNDETSDLTINSFTTPWDKPILASLDLLSFMMFAAIGKASHSADGSIDISAVLTTAFPFLVSWFGTSPFTGVYNTVNESDEGKIELLDSVKVTFNGWLLAVPLGCVGRGFIKGYVPPLPFVIITLISTLVILTVVRSLYTLFVEGENNKK